MVDRSFGGRALPGVQISVGRSNQDLADLKRSFAGVEDELRRVQQAARDASAAINAIKAPASGGRTSSGKSAGASATRAGREPTTDDLDRQIARQQTRMATADRRIKAAQDNAAYTRLRTDQRAKDRELDRKLGIGAKEADRSSLLYRAVNFAGWAPGIPPEVFMAQMALGEMGAGLSLPLVAAGMGAMGLGEAGLGLNAAFVAQNRTGEQMAAQLGTTPAFETGGGVTAQMAGLARQYHLSGEQPQQIAGGLVAGGLSRTDALGTAFAQAAVLVNTFGMTIQDATKLVGTQYTDLGRSTEQVTGLLQNLAGVALSTGVPLSSIGAVLSGSADLQANVGAGGGAAAAVFRSVYGDNQQATDMANIANAHGIGAFGLAGFLGMDVNALDALRSTPQGQGQVVDRLDARIRGLVANSAGGVEGAYASFNQWAQSTGNPTLSYEGFLRAANAAPDAGVLAAQAASHPIAGPPAPGSAEAGIANLAAGNLPGAAQASQPWNVKDMTVNAASLTLANVGGGVQSLQAVLSGHAGTDQLQQIAGQGGLQGLAAGAGLALGPHWGAILAQIASGINAATSNGGPTGAAQALANQIVEHVLHLDVDVRQNGQTIGTKQITSPLPNSGQSYGQYTPPSGTRQGGPR